MFKLTVLGKYGAYPKTKSASSGYLLSFGTDKILFEAGSGVFSRLLDITPPENLSFVICTHLHFDHISDLGVLNYYLLLNGNKKLKVYCPMKDASINFDNYKNLEFIPIEENKKLSLNGLEIRFYKMKHPVDTYGFKATYNDRTLAFTGDTNYCKNVETLAEKSNLFLCDGAFIQKDYAESKPHMSIEMCCKIGEKYNTRTVVTHINPEYSKKLLKQSVKNYKAEIAKELKDYDI